jgi:hypothetical protein
MRIDEWIATAELSKKQANNKTKYLQRDVTPRQGGYQKHSQKGIDWTVEEVPI